MITAPPVVTIAVTFAPAGFSISTDATRKPFIGICGMQKLTIESQEGFYFWTKVLSFTATSFTIEIRALTNSLGFVTNFPVKFRYLIVSSSFPSIYLSRDIYISGSPTMPKAMAANDVYSESFSINTLSPTNYINFPLGNDTKILYAISDITIN